MQQAAVGVARAVMLAALALIVASCAGKGYRSDSYYPSGYVYYPSYVQQGGVSNGYYYGPRNEHDRPASSTDFDWATTTSRRP
jgi:hypothetical protein